MARKRKHRIGFLEQEGVPIVEDEKELEEPGYEVPVDYVDFLGEPIDPFVTVASNEDGKTLQMETRGETAARVVTRIFWMIIRIAVISFIFWFVIRGSQCGMIEFV